MDESVVAAMAKWPNVPDVYGWLSLSVRGEWRLHPNGDALPFAPYGDETASRCWQRAHSGLPITSPQLLRFINRNYACDDSRRWYFQNGPQRVFVRLDVAPFVFHTTISGAAGNVHLCAHTGRVANCVRGWWLDDHGKLYAETDVGAGLIAGRDMQSVLETLSTADGRSVLAAMEGAMEQSSPQQPLLVNSLGGEPHTGDDASDDTACTAPVPLRFCKASDVAYKLGFVQYPHASRKPDSAM